MQNSQYFCQPIILGCSRINVIIFLQMATYLSLKLENFAVLSKNIHYYFDNKNFMR
jgi:hypothetical protein